MTLPMVPIMRPALGEAEVEASARVIRSGWVTQGPEVQAFERELAERVGATFACAVSNCTVAIELALRALGVGPGDEVVTVSHSFVATANAVVAVGARPVFIDVCDDDLGMDPALLEAAITPRTRAVLAVHQLGMPCRIRAIVAIADAHGIPVVEDAACAIGSALVDDDGVLEPIGRPVGKVACFSFHPRKIVTTGDGGMLTTNDAALDARFRLLRQHAMSISDVKRHAATEVVFEDYVEPAFNYRLTDLQAAVGRPQLARLDAIVAERQRLAAIFHAALVDNSVLEPPQAPAGTHCNWQSYPTRLRAGARFTQVQVMQRFLDAKIATKRGVSNAHQEPAYMGAERGGCSSRVTGAGCPRGCTAGRCARLSVSERVRDTTIILPLFQGMTDVEVERVLAVCSALHDENVANTSTPREPEQR